MQYKLSSVCRWMTHFVILFIVAFIYIHSHFSCCVYELSYFTHFSIFFFFLCFLCLSQFFSMDFFSSKLSMETTWTRCRLADESFAPLRSSCITQLQFNRAHLPHAHNRIVASYWVFTLTRKQNQSNSPNSPRLIMKKQTDSCSN